jgi:cbb3-type cytochrome oxidase maturation protein
MEILKILIPMALILGSVFVLFFIWAAKSGQFDDLDTPSKRILLDDDSDEHNKTHKRKEV